MKILLSLMYVGSAFCGYQVQRNARTVQKVMQDALEALYGFRPDVVGCSRTDSGVHARDFKMTYSVCSEMAHIPPQRISKALDAFLPDDLSCVTAEIVDDAFHVRHHVIEKQYEYYIWNGEYRNPFYVQRAFYVPFPLDTKAMNQAAAYFIGTHDFSGFMAANSDCKDTVRRITQASVTQQDQLIRFSVKGNGFLYHMVRIMAGTLIEVGKGKISPYHLPDIILSKDRTQAGFTAPSCGLYLASVILDEKQKKGGEHLGG